MAIITIPTNAGPTAGETFVTMPVRSILMPDGTVATGSALFDASGTALDCEYMNAMAMSIVGDDDDEYDSSQAVDGVTNWGITPGFS